MLLEAAIGDAYGAGFEFREINFIKENNDLSKYHKHGIYTEIYKKYTDDTQMSIAIAEMLLENENWNEIKVADKFVEVFHRDKRRGYSDRVYDALDASKNGEDFLKNISYQSNGNGSSMRAYPIGHLNDVNVIMELCEIQARTSHNTKEGIICSKRIALAVHFYKYRLYKHSDLIDFLNETLKENENYYVTSPIDMHGYPTTQAVIKIVSQANSMSTCLKEGIDYGGDTDTVAALSLAILSQNVHCDKKLPSFLENELENGAYGKDYIKQIDNQLNLKYSEK